MPAGFIEVTDRRDGTTVVVFNTDRVIKVADDGTGAVITINGINGIETHVVNETYATIKTALGL